MARRIALVVNRSKPEAQALEPMVREAIEAHGVLSGIVNIDEIAGACGDADALVVIGGDGTLLTTARSCLGTATPVIGVNAGRLGFMAAYDAETFVQDAPRLLDAGEPLRTLPIPTLLASVRSGDAETWKSEALNEFVVTAGPPYRMISLALNFDGVEGPMVNGDGLIVSTPLGSTAYNVSAGGPIAAPGSAGMIVTPIAAHSLAFRPLVVASDTLVKIDLIRGNESDADGGTRLVADGQVSTALMTGDRVSICATGRAAHFVVNPRGSYWRTLVEKMGWGAAPGQR